MKETTIDLKAKRRALLPVWGKMLLILTVLWAAYNYYQIGMIIFNYYNTAASDRAESIMVGRFVRPTAFLLSITVPCLLLLRGYLWAARITIAGTIICIGITSYHLYAILQLPQVPLSFPLYKDFLAYVVEACLLLTAFLMRSKWEHVVVELSDHDLLVDSDDLMQQRRDLLPMWYKVVHYVLLAGMAYVVLKSLYIFTQDLSDSRGPSSLELIGIGALIVFETFIGFLIFAVLYGYRWAIDTALIFASLFACLLIFGMFSVNGEKIILLVMLLLDIFMIVTYSVMRKRWLSPSDPYV